MLTNLINLNRIESKAKQIGNIIVTIRNDYMVNNIERVLQQKKNEKI